MRAGPGCPFVNPARVHLGEVAAAVKAQSLTRQYRKIARFDAVSDARITTTSSTEMVTGLHRCAEADVVIARNLSILHDVIALAADVDLAVSVFYVVAFGAAVVTATHFVAAHCSPWRVPPQHIAYHVPALKTKFAFALGDRLATEHPDVRRALKRVTSTPGSNMKLRTPQDSARASGGCHFQTLSDVVAWASSVRAVKQVRGQKAFAVDGMRSV